MAISFVNRITAKLTKRGRLLLLKNRMTLNGFSQNEISLIVNKVKDPRQFKNCYPYYKGINLIRKLVNAQKKRTVLVVEGKSGNGKTYLSDRLKDGKDLGLFKKDIAIIREDDYFWGEYKEEGMRNLAKAFTKSLNSGKKLVIYDGHYFRRSPNEITDVLTRIASDSNDYNVLGIRVLRAQSRNNMFLTCGGAYIHQILYFHYTNEACHADIARYIEVKDDPFLKVPRTK